MKDKSEITIPPAFMANGEKPFVGFYDAKRVLPLKNSGCSCDLTEISNYFEEKIGALSNVYDAKGSSITAERNAKIYANRQIAALSNSYDKKGAADTAEQNANAYTDEQISALSNLYDKKGTARTALSLANEYTDDVRDLLSDYFENSKQDKLTDSQLSILDSDAYSSIKSNIADLDEQVKLILSVLYKEDESYGPPVIPDDPSQSGSGGEEASPEEHEYYFVPYSLFDSKVNLLYEIFHGKITSLTQKLQEQEELIQQLENEKISSILDTWDPFALSDETDYGGKPNTRQYLSGYLVDLSSDFTMADMENSFYGIQGMLNSCYFNAYGKPVPFIPYDEEVTATYIVSTYTLTTQNVVNEQGLSSYDYGIGDFWNYPIGSTIDISERNNPLSSRSPSHGISGIIWQDEPPPDSQCWEFTLSHLVEEKQSIGPTFDHLRKTYNAIVSGFIDTQSNFEILFKQKNVKTLEQEETTMDILQSAMNNLIYALSGTHNSQSDILYHNLAQFIEQTDPDNPTGEYSLDTVAKATRELAIFLKNNF